MKTLAIKLKGVGVSKKLRISMMVALVSILSMVPAFAADTDVTSTLTTSFQTIISDCLSMIGSILPIALTVFGASIAVAFGIKWFKKIIGKA